METPRIYGSAAEVLVPAGNTYISWITIRTRLWQHQNINSGLFMILYYICIYCRTCSCMLVVDCCICSVFMLLIDLAWPTYKILLRISFKAYTLTYLFYHAKAFRQHCVPHFIVLSKAVLHYCGHDQLVKISKIIYKAVQHQWFHQFQGYVVHRYMRYNDNG